MHRSREGGGGCDVTPDLSYDKRASSRKRVLDHTFSIKFTNMDGPKKNKYLVRQMQQCNFLVSAGVVRES